MNKVFCLWVFKTKKIKDSSKINLVGIKKFIINKLELVISLIIL